MASIARVGDYQPLSFPTSKWSIDLKRLKNIPAADLVFQREEDRAEWLRTVPYENILAACSVEQAIAVLQVLTTEDFLTKSEFVEHLVRALAVFESYDRTPFFIEILKADRSPSLRHTLPLQALLNYDADLHEAPFKGRLTENVRKLLTVERYIGKLVKDHEAKNPRLALLEFVDRRRDMIDSLDRLLYGDFLNVLLSSKTSLEDLCAQLRV
jgi:hypothetical protein